MFAGSLLFLPDLRTLLRRTIGIRTIYVGKRPWACRPPPLSLFFYIPQWTGAKEKGLWKRNFKITRHISKGEESQNQNCSIKSRQNSKPIQRLSDHQAQSLWSIASQLIQKTRIPQTQTANVRVHPKLGWKQASYRHGKQTITCDLHFSSNNR